MRHLDKLVELHNKVARLCDSVKATKDDIIHISSSSEMLIDKLIYHNGEIKKVVGMEKIYTYQIDEYLYLHKIFVNNDADVLTDMFLLEVLPC